MSDDELCRICGEPRSAHVPTAKGPLTHPREARGEGTYVRKDAGWISGALCGPLGTPDEYWERWEFVPKLASKDIA